MQNNQPAATWQHPVRKIVYPNIAGGRDFTVTLQVETEADAVKHASRILREFHPAKHFGKPAIAMIPMLHQTTGQLKRGTPGRKPK